MRAIVHTDDDDADDGVRAPGGWTRTVRRGRNLTLDALAPEHYDRLHAALTVPGPSAAWRSRGQYIPLHEWERFLTVGLALGLVAFDDRGALVGLVEVRDHDPRDRIAYLSAAATPSFLGSGLLVEAIVLAVDEAFASLDLLKVTFILSESSVTALGADRLSELLAVEGVLRSHTHLEGRRQDVTVAAMHRAAFAEVVRRTPWLASLSDGPWRTVDLPAGGDGSDVLTVDRLAELLGRDVDEMTPGTPLLLEQLDSLTRLELIAELEAVRGHSIAPELLATLETVGDYLDWLEP